MAHEKHCDYYYAEGRRVPLKAAEGYCAVDLERVQSRVLTASVQELLDRSGAALRRGVAVLLESDVPDGIRAELEQRGALQPVYEYLDALIVILPEIRVEETRRDQRARLDTWIEKHRGEADVSEADDRIVLTPKSGHGGDALRLANEIHEQVEPEMVQTRMLRIVSKPGPHRLKRPS